MKRNRLLQHARLCGRHCCPPDSHHKDETGEDKQWLFIVNLGLTES